jgi:hypothetical protein
MFQSGTKQAELGLSAIQYLDKIIKLNIKKTCLRRAKNTPQALTTTKS